MEENRNSRKMYRIIAIVSCAVVVIALGIFLGYKLAKKDTPKEVLTNTPAEALANTPTEAPTEAPTNTPTEAPRETEDTETHSPDEQIVGAGEWVMSKKYLLQEGEEYLREEYFYDEQGRLTEERTYNLDGSLYWTEYHLYDCNGERMEHWTPDRGGSLDLVRFTDMTDTVVYVDGYFGEVCREDFFDDGFIKEFRIYQSAEQSEKKLVTMVQWEYDSARKNIRRISYTYDSDGESELAGDLRVELDSEGRIARKVKVENPNGVQSVTEYQYEGNRRIETVTWGTGTDEFVYKGNHLISSRVRMGSGTVRVTERFYPNVNWPRMEFWGDYLESVTEIAEDGTETPLYKVEFTNDGKPLREIAFENGEGVVVVEYRYGSGGKLSAVLTRHFHDSELTEAVVIKPDQYGNPGECDVYMFGVHERYEWIRLSDAEQ